MSSSRRPLVLFALAYLPLLAPSACGSSSGGPAVTPSGHADSGSAAVDGGSGDDGASDDGGGSGSGGSSGSSGSSGSGGSSGGGSTDASSDGHGGPSGACPVKVVATDFGGVDLSHPPTDAVEGCSRGLDTSKGTLSLILAAGAPAVVDTYQGAIRANGIACAAPDGTPATVANVKGIIVKGSTGNDSLFLDMAVTEYTMPFLKTAGAFSIDLGDGNDTVSIRGTECNDSYAASAGASGATFVDLGAGASTLHMSNVESLVASLGQGADTFTAGGTAPATLPVTVFGDSGNDAISGGAGDDILNGDADDDSFDQGSGPSGADVINGGNGHDSITYANRTHGVTVILCDSTQTDGCSAGTCTCAATSGEMSENETVVNVEDATGGPGDDVLTGNAEANTLDGNAGNDQLDGQAGDDTLYGDEGNDTLLGGDGDDLLNGGTGSETIDGQTGTNICLCVAAPKTIANCQVASGC